MLKRTGSAYQPGRQSAWQKVKARHRATVTLRSLAVGRDGKTFVVCDLDGRRVVALSGQRLASRVGGEVELVYSRVDADGSFARGADLVGARGSPRQCAPSRALAQPRAIQGGSGPMPGACRTRPPWWPLVGEGGRESSPAPTT